MLLAMIANSVEQSHCSPCFSIHRNCNFAWDKIAASLIAKMHLEIISRNVSSISENYNYAL